ncbi:MAG: serine hydrolase [Bacteroidota bacterium]
MKSFRILLFLSFITLLSGCKVGRFVYYNFANITDHRIFPSRELKAPDQAFTFHSPAKALRFDSLTITTKGKSKKMSFEEFLTENKTVAFLVIRNDTMLYEYYTNGYKKNDIVASFSMAKSINSILIGCAIQDGLIQSVDEPITNYLPHLKKNGLENVTIDHLLNMTSGIGFNENYFNPFGDAASFYYGRRLDKETAEMKPVHAPGTEFSYSSGDSQLLGMVLQASLKGKPITTYLQEKLWTPLQMEHDASWSLDRKNGTEKTFCCVNAVARDFAKIGRLYLNKGNWNGKQLVPEQWVSESTTSSTANGRAPFYRNQWWLFPKFGAYEAQGILGQYIYVYPDKNMVIVRLGKNYGKYGGWTQVFESICLRS